MQFIPPRIGTAMNRHALALLALLSLNAWAAEPRPEPVPDIPPPPGVVDQTLEPQVTIKQGDIGRIEEYRIRGRLYMVKVTPPHGTPYYLLDLNGDGQMRRFDDLSPDFKVPMWVLGTF